MHFLAQLVEIAAGLWPNSAGSASDADRHASGKCLATTLHATKTPSASMFWCTTVNPLLARCAKGAQKYRKNDVRHVATYPIITHSRSKVQKKPPALDNAQRPDPFKEDA